MNIKDIKIMKTQVEDAIGAILDQFETSTRLIITDIVINKLDITSMDSKQSEYINKIKVEVKL